MFNRSFSINADKLARLGRMRTITTHGAGIRGFRVPEEQVSTLDKVSKCHTGDRLPRLLKELFHVAL